MRPGLITLAAILAIVACHALADCPLQVAASIPLLPGDHPLIQASINGKSVQMIVDTGATVTTVTPEASAILGLRPDPTRRTNNRTVGGDELSRNAILDTFRIGDLSYKTYSASVLLLGAKGSGLSPAGLLGTDILGGYDIELDFPGRMFTLYRNNGCVPIRPLWNGEYSIISGGGVNQRRFLFPVELNGHSVNALFDTGSRGEIVTRTVLRQFGISDAQLNNDLAGTGTSAGQHQYEARRHRFDTLKIGAETFHDIPLDVVDSHQPGLEMLVGVDYMHARRFFLSWTTGMLFVQKPPAPPADPTWPQCPPPADVVPTLARASPVAVNRPRIGVPEKVVSDHIDGCAGVMFHVAADGTPTDIRLVIERPPGYGLGLLAVREISVSLFSVTSASDQWYYEVHRYRESPVH